MNRLSLPTRDPAPLGRAAMDGAEFPKLVAVADLQPYLLPLELEVLGIEADGGLGVDPVLAADPRGALDLRAGPDLGAVADLDPRADHREGADRDPVPQSGGGIDERQRMDAGPPHQRLTIPEEGTASH